MEAKIHEFTAYRDRSRVFEDRFEAGAVLGDMLAAEYGDGENNVVLAIPAGGVPVGIAVREKLAGLFDLLIVRKIQIPGNTEAGFGAMTSEGDIFLNEDLLSTLSLAKSEIDAQIDKTRADLEERNRIFREGRPFPNLKGKTVILVDDGLASGYTMIASIHTVKKREAEKIIVAVPTAPLSSIENIRKHAEEIWCANVRHGAFFAVANAYRRWYDLSREEVVALVRERGL